MICITGSETTVADLRERISRHRGADLHEIRLDLLEEPFPPSVDLGVDPRRLLMTCRPEREGGGFTGPDRDRIDLLAGIVSNVRPAWVDLESSVAADERSRAVDAAQEAGTRILTSRHEWIEGSAEHSGRLLDRLEEVGGDALKLAVAVDDAAELTGLREAAQKRSLPVVVLGMGPAGLLSRALYDRFGSTWTYAATEEGQETAPGQLTVRSFDRWRLPPGRETKLFALLGGAQVMESPGPRVYNRLFAKEGIDACYLPVVTERPAETMALLVDLGLRGASITMPLKERVSGLLDQVGLEAGSTGVVNTITVGKGGALRGDLTDGEGALAALLRCCGEVRERQVVVLGTGGTAAAIASALRSAGAQVTVLGRSARRAEELASRIAVRSGVIDDLNSTPFDVLVNATPVGASGSEESLVRDASILRGKIVLDAVNSEQTRLLSDTRERGGLPVSGRAMWAEQGRRQLHAWLGIDVPAAELEEKR
jgi:3-dehydroquinate dehydratase/shikimate dehydrogenase